MHSLFHTARYNESVLEGLTPGSLFAQITATDADSEIFGQITYNIISQPSVSKGCGLTYVVTLCRVYNYYSSFMVI